MQDTTTILGVAALEEREFRRIADVVMSHAGITLNAGKRDMVFGRLARRLRALQLPDFAAYCELVESPSGADELPELINAITTNVTAFFRESHHFRHLRDQLLRRRVEDAAAGKPRTLRIWSAGCSSGEEPYTIAMTIAGALRDLDRWDVRILATDIDTNVLDRAKAGIYPASATEAIPPTLAQRFLEPAPGREGAVRVVERLRRMIAFRQLQLHGPWPMSKPFDAIFCRNVMIYFDNDHKQELCRRFASLLPIGGLLYIGHSEAILMPDNPFVAIGRTTHQRTQ